MNEFTQLSTQPVTGGISRWK